MHNMSYREFDDEIIIVCFDGLGKPQRVPNKGTIRNAENHKETLIIHVESHYGKVNVSVVEDVAIVQAKAELRKIFAEWTKGAIEWLKERVRNMFKSIKGLTQYKFDLAVACLEMELGKVVA